MEWQGGQSVATYRGMQALADNSAFCLQSNSSAVLASLLPASPSQSHPAQLGRRRRARRHAAPRQQYQHIAVCHHITQLGRGVVQHAATVHLQATSRAQGTWVRGHQDAGRPRQPAARAPLLLTCHRRCGRSPAYGDPAARRDCHCRPPRPPGARPRFAPRCRAPPGAQGCPASAPATSSPFTEHLE